MRIFSSAENFRLRDAANVHAGAISECDPAIPDAIFNRAADNWAPLLAIAGVIGGDVPELVRQAALAACGVQEEPSHGAMLLADIRDAYAETGGDRMSSADLVAALVAMTDKPWGECNHGKALTQNGLARRLKPFGISPKDIGPKTNRLKGYELSGFKDAFSRYLPDSRFQSAHPHTIYEINGLDENQSAQPESECAVVNSSNALNLRMKNRKPTK